MQLLSDISAAINRPLSAEECEMLIAAREKHRHEYSYAAAAVRLGFSPGTVAQYAKRGLLQKSRRGHIAAASISAFILSRSARGGAGLREVSVRKEASPVRVMALSPPTEAPRAASFQSANNVVTLPVNHKEEHP